MTRDFDPNFKPTHTYFLVGGKAIVTKDDKILLLKRSEKSGHGGEWSFPGGAVEEEDAVDGIRREIDEELLIRVKNVKPFNILTRLEKKPTIMIGFVCDYDSGEIDLNWEHDEYKWLDPKEAMDLPLTPDAKYFLGEYTKHLIE